MNDGKMLVRERARGTVFWAEKKRASEKLRRKGLTYCKIICLEQDGQDNEQ